jgi:hypothetical protein
MRPGSRVDSKKFDIAVSDNDYPPRPSVLEPLRRIQIRNSGGWEKPADRIRN